MMMSPRKKNYFRAIGPLMMRMLNKTVKLVVIWGDMMPMWQEFNYKNMNIVE